MEKIFIKCYVAGKKAGIICDGSQFVLGHYFGAWNDGTTTSDRHGFLKFAGLQARTIDEARAEIVPDSPEWEALLQAETTEAYETMYTALNPSDCRTLATLGEFLMAVPEAWGSGLWAFIKDFCTDMGWSWIEPGEEPSACDIVPICTDEERTLYVEIGPWEEPISYTII